MIVQETSHTIDETASGWAARLDSAPLPPAEEIKLQSWLNSDPRAKGALMRAQAMSLMSESARALGPDFNPASFQQPSSPQQPNRNILAGLSRRQALGWTGGAAVAAASAVVLGVSLPAAGATVTTSRGEMRLVPLKDGSTALLNTDSSIRIGYTDSQRFITLLTGEAYFSVVQDAQRPFIVDVNGRLLSTAQAAFSVRKLDDNPVDVLVQQGQISLPPAKNAPRPANALSLHANMRILLSGPAPISPHTEMPHSIAPDTIMRELAWREGKLSFEGETLQQAADAFARYSDTRIMINDPALAREPVTGLFAANDPAGFSQAIARIFDARLERGEDRLVLSRPAATQ